MRLVMVMAERANMEQKSINLSDLEFDPENPRLPEWVERDDESILEHITENYSLDELIHSFLDNGYFEAERLIVIESVDNGGRYVVVEGNRRLAALKILHNQDAYAGFSDISIEPDKLANLSDIPCLIVYDRNDINTYLAYRHIGGMKTWSAEAKARFIMNMADNLAQEGDSNPFKTIGRKIGSNALGVRNSYLALAILRFAHDELNQDTSYLQYRRFGVWTRCMNSQNIREYINIGTPRDYQSIQESLIQLDADKLREIIGDLSIRRDGRQAIVNDSRLVTDYGRILQNEIALHALRTHEDISIALRIVEQQSIPSRIENISNQIGTLIDEVARGIDLQTALESKAPAERMLGYSRSLSASISSLLESDD